MAGSLLLLRACVFVSENQGLPGKTTPWCFEKEEPSKKGKSIQYKKQLGGEPKPAGGKMWVVLMGTLGHLYVLLHVTLRDRVMPGWSKNCWL